MAGVGRESNGPWQGSSLCAVTVSQHIADPMRAGLLGANPFRPRPRPIAVTSGHNVGLRQCGDTQPRLRQHRHYPPIAIDRLPAHVHGSGPSSESSIPSSSGLRRYARWPECWRLMATASSALATTPRNRVVNINLSSRVRLPAEQSLVNRRLHDRSVGLNANAELAGVHENSRATGKIGAGSQFPLFRAHFANPVVREAIAVMPGPLGSDCRGAGATGVGLAGLVKRPIHLGLPC